MANAESIAGDIASAPGGARFRRKGPVKRTVTYPHGPGVKWPRLYRKFRRKGWTKEKAARVSNEMYNKIRSGRYKRRKPRPPFPGVGGVYPAGNVTALAEGVSADLARWGRVNPKTVRKGRGGLGRWFNEKWVDISRPLPEGGFAPCGRPDADKGAYPKCVPESVAMKMSQKEIDSAVRRKRAAENKAKKRKDMRDGKKPINVSTFAKAESKNVPTDTKLYEQVKAEAKRKFDVYPSAYANGWLVQEYKRRGGGYRIEKHGTAGDTPAERLITGHRQRGAASTGKFKPILRSEILEPGDNGQMVLRGRATNTRAVSAEEFQKIASQGQKIIDISRTKSDGVKGLEKNLSSLSDDAWKRTREPYGGVTINAATGETLTSDGIDFDNLGKPSYKGRFAVTVKTEGQESISIPIDASREEFDDAMRRAIAAFPQLEYSNHYLGVFNDTELGRIDFDPVYVAGSRKAADAVGAASHSLGGAFNFDDGYGYWPPYVSDNIAKAESKSVEKAACPISTRDTQVNIRNRAIAKRDANYRKATTSERCGNCRAYDQSADMMKCISDGGVGSASAVAKREIGFCKSLDFMCASSNTCDGWVAGGPIEKNQPSGGDVHVDRPLGSSKYKDPEGGLTAAGRRQFKEETGANLKPGVKNYDKASTADKKRWISWALRFYGRETYPPMVDKKGRPTRFALTANAWGEPVPTTEAEGRKIAAKARRRQKELEGLSKRLDRNDLRKALIGKREFSEEERSDLAEKGHAMPDGSYPIVNGGDLKNALQAIGRAKNRAATIRHIRRRAEELGLESTLPDWAK